VSDDHAQRRTRRAARLTPIMVDMTGWRALVVGGGPIGARRAASLVEAGAEVEVVSPLTSEGIDRMARDGSIAQARRDYSPDDLERRDIVVAATGDARVDGMIREGTARAGILCNVAADAEACDVVFPSTVRRGDLIVAVSTGGASPAVASRLREIVEDAIGLEWATLIELLDERREALRDAVPDSGDRRVAIDRLLETDVLELIRAGRVEDARRQVDESLGVA